MADTAAPDRKASAPEDSFDYIIVGGGTAGLAVASRLSEDREVSVVVIEAGGDRARDPVVVIPGLVGGLYGKDEYDWNFISAPQPNLQGRTINQPRGRMLGGSSGLNFMMVAYPSRGIIDSWGELGNEGWSFDALAPYFRKFAKTYDPSASAMEISRMEPHYDAELSKAESGSLAVSFSDGYSAVNSGWMDAFSKLGLRMTADPRAGKAVGAFQNGASIDPATKTRSFSATAYLTEEVRSRPNLTVLVNTVVSRIVFRHSEGDADPIATGVSILSQDGHESTINARLEVILAAGALQSPQILELSGIGGKELLERHGIPVIVDNPNVGEHMQDHAAICQGFEVAPGIPSGDVLRDPVILNAVLSQYQATGDGPMGQSNIICAYAPVVDAAGAISQEERTELFDKYLPSPAAASEAYALEQDITRKLLEKDNEPAIQYLLFPGQSHIPAHPRSMMDYLNIIAPQNFLTIMTLLNHPFSRGSCHIVSPDVKEKPLWDPNFNSEEVDLEIAARAIRFIETLVATPPMTDVFLPGGARLPEIRADTLENAREVVRQRQVSIFHVCSSCAMLPRERGGVVDARLRVYGVKNVRVVDASVFPLEPLGNIQATIYAVAERAADLIKEDRK